MIVDKAIIEKLIYIGSTLPVKIQPDADSILGLKYEDINIPRGLPLRNDLRKLRRLGGLYRIRGLDAQLVNQNTNWYFRRVE